MTITAPATRSAPSVPAPDHPTFCAAFQATAARYGDRVALRTPGDGVRVTWAGYAERVRATAARLAGLGVGRGDTVAQLLTMRPEAASADLAAMHLGAAGLSLYLAGTPAAHAYVLDDADVRVLVTERSLAGRRAGPAARVPEARARDRDRRRRPGVTALGELPPAAGFDLEAVAAAVLPDDRLTLMYTSGTTGAPKGVVYSHRALLAAFAGFDSAVPATEWLHAVAYIPFAHAGQRAMGHYRSLLRGSTTTFCPDPAALPAVIADARPSALFAPPAIWQGLAAGAPPRWLTTPPPGRRRAACWRRCAVGRRRLRRRSLPRSARSASTDSTSRSSAPRSPPPSCSRTCTRSACRS